MKLLLIYFLLSNYSLFSQVDTVSMVFGGDCTFAHHFEDYVKDNFTYPFQKMKILKDYDIFMVNLENPISLKGTKVEKEFNFRMNPKYLCMFEDAGIDIVTIANNHIYDYGEEALFDTMKYLDSIGIYYVGAGKNLEEARKPIIFNIKNKKIGFLAYFGNGSWYPATANKAGTVPRFKKYIEDDIKKLKKNVDFIVVNFHWGEESQEFPNNYQKDLAHFTIDMGANLVIGHHPHVLQGIEKYKDGVIVYSLGNFIFGGNGRRKYETILFEVKITDNKVLYNIIPLLVVNWQPILLENYEKEKIIKKVMKLSEIFNKSIF